MQHGVPARGAGATRRLRSAVPRGGRRRRHLLAPAGRRAPARLQPGGRRVALAAPVGACVPAPAARLRRGRGAAGAQVAAPLRARRAARAGAAGCTGAGWCRGIGRGARVLRDLGLGALPGAVRRAARTRSRRSGRFRSGTSRCVALAARSLAALWWAPLLVALPAARRGACRWVRARARSARRAPRSCTSALPRRRKLKMWALTTFLHLAQPLARLRGRMRTPPWRPVEAAACRRPAAPHRGALERGVARGRGSARGRRARRARGRRARLLRQHLGPLGPAPARRPAGRSPAADGARGARRRAPARAHADHAARAGRGGRDRHGARGRRRGGCAVPCLGGRGADRHRVGRARRRGAVGVRGRDGVARAGTPGRRGREGARRSIPTSRCTAGSRGRCARTGSTSRPSSSSACWRLRSPCSRPCRSRSRWTA